jgi:holo-[acyl-carrier protein] synthase
VKIRVGVDMVSVERVARLVAGGDGVSERIFTPGELEYCRPKRQRVEHMAARFAAKEAVLKAFGTGLGHQMRWTDVEIAKTARGRPVVRLHGEVAALAKRRGLEDLDVSLSHTGGLALAQAVAVWQDDTEQPCAST